MPKRIEAHGMPAPPGLELAPRRSAERGTSTEASHPMEAIPPRASASPPRDAILAAIQAHPGIHFRALSRAARIPSSGQLRHHLDRLKALSQVAEVRDGQFARFVPVVQHSATLRATVVALARPAAARIATMLLPGPVRRDELRRGLGLAEATVTYHMTRLVASGCVQRRMRHQRCHYALKDPALVRQVLALDASLAPSSA